MYSTFSRFPSASARCSAFPSAAQSDHMPACPHPAETVGSTLAGIQKRSCDRSTKPSPLTRISHHMPPFPTDSAWTRTPSARLTRAV